MAFEIDVTLLHFLQRNKDWHGDSMWPDFTNGSNNKSLPLSRSTEDWSQQVATLAVKKAK